MKYSRGLLASLMLILSVSVAQAQVQAVPTSELVGETFVPVTQPCTPGLIYPGSPAGGSCFGFSGVDTNSIASVSQVNSALAAMSQMNAEVSRAFELSAITAAMNDAIPNPGDRFAIRISAAGFSGETAGALSASYNFTDNARISINYGQGRSQSVVSGGLTLSFH